MAALATVEYRCFDLRWCYLQQTVHFSSQIRAPSFPTDWASLVSTVRSPTLKGLRPDKPSHKHVLNKYQTKAFVICGHKSTRSSTHVNKTYQWFDWCIDCYLINTTSTAPIRNCVHGRTQFFKIVGFAGKRFLLSPPPPPSFIIFTLFPTFSRKSRGRVC